MRQKNFSFIFLLLFFRRHTSRFLLMLMVSGAMCVRAQDINVKAELDTPSILIGQQTKLRLSVKYRIDKGKMKIDFPKLNDSIIRQIEIVEKSEITSFIPDSNDLMQMAQSQVLTITSFDSGYYAIPPLKFVVNGDTAHPYETEPLLFTVNTVAVDTTKAIKDIKPPLEVPFSWEEYLPYFYWGAGIIALLAVLFYFVRKYLKNRKRKPVPVIVPPKIPPHITALQRLDELKEKKLWQNGKVKLYHSEISEIIRQYIEHRFFISAMEQVTDEILFSFRSVEINEELKSKLRKVLFLSDLVKFAKEQPLPTENETSLQYAKEFILLTKEEEKNHEKTNHLTAENVPASKAVSN